MKSDPSFPQPEGAEQSKEAILGSIMTVEEYSELRHETPYLFELKRGDKELFYFGASHTRDPKNPMLQEIEKAFVSADPEIVFVEGISAQNDRDRVNEKMGVMTREEVIHRAGEAGFTLKLALEKGIEWQSPEPPDAELNAHLLEKGFSKEEVFAWAILLVLPQYHRRMKKEGFVHYAQTFIEMFKQSTGWKGFDYSYEHALQTGERILGKTIDVEGGDGAIDYIDPIPWEGKREKQTVLNRIAAESTYFRDRKIVADIADAFKTHNKVFVVYGSSHAAMQEPALRKFFEGIKI